MDLNIILNVILNVILIVIVQARAAYSILWNDVRLMWSAGSGWRDIPSSDWRLIRKVSVDLIKLVPLLVCSVAPGGALVVVLISRFMPWSLPSTLQNAPRWEKYVNP